jgi:hypothetical protein
MATFLSRAVDQPPTDADFFSDDEASSHEAGINRLAQAGIARGCTTDEFCPNDPVTRAQMAAFLSRALDLPPVGIDAFSDDDGDIHEAAINALASAGITSGCDAGQPERFCPGDTVSRAQMAAFLSRALDLPGTSQDFFTDDDGHSLEISINRVAAAGITSGCAANRYCPNNPVTRGQMASFIDRAFDLPATSNDFFIDDEGSTHEDAINRLAEAGITLGCGGTSFCPTSSVSREQMASFLRRALNLGPASRDFFTDDTGSIHEDDINRVAEASITLGCGGTSFCPGSPVSREQMAAFLYRALGP